VKGIKANAAFGTKYHSDSAENQKTQYATAMPTGATYGNLRSRRARRRGRRTGEGDDDNKEDEDDEDDDEGYSE
jgi:hypothetical protein